MFCNCCMCSRLRKNVVGKTDFVPHIKRSVMVNSFFNFFLNSLVEMHHAHCVLFRMHPFNVYIQYYSNYYGNIGNVMFSIWFCLRMQNKPNDDTKLFWKEFSVCLCCHHDSPNGIEREPKYNLRNHFSFYIH